MGCADFTAMLRPTVLMKQKPRAISYVLTGGLAAALLKPEIARNTVDILPNAVYAGCFFTVCAVQLISLFFAGLKIPKPAVKSGTGRPIGMFIRMPVFVWYAVQCDC